MHVSNAGYKTYRITEALAEACEKLADQIGGMSANAIVERCVKEMLEIVESKPGERFEPMTCIILDAIRYRVPARLHSAEPVVLPARAANAARLSAEHQSAAASSAPATATPAAPEPLPDTARYKIPRKPRKPVLVVA